MNITPELLRNSVLATLVYFNNIEYPLTLLELYKNLIFNINKDLFHNLNETNLSLSELENFIIKDPCLSKIVDNKQGFYFIFDNKKIVDTRNVRFGLSEIKYKKALRVAKLLSKFPFIKLIAVCNTLSYSNVTINSDLDFFIVVSKNRLWLTRSMLFVFLDLFRLRPKGENTKDKVCLSYFVTEDNLNLENASLNGYDIYYYYWLAGLVIIYDNKNFSDSFYNHNKWLKKYLPFFLQIKINKRRKISNNSEIKIILEKIFKGRLGDYLERFSKKVQLKILNKKIKKLSNNNGKKIIINDAIIKTHGEMDNRKFIQDRFEQSFQNIKYGNNKK